MTDLRSAMPPRTTRRLGRRDTPERRPVPNEHPGRPTEKLQTDLRMLAVTLERVAEALRIAAREAECVAVAAEPAGPSRSLGDAQLLTVAEAARALRLSRSKLYSHVLGGDIPSITLGRSRRIPAAALADWVERLQANQVDETITRRSRVL